MAVELFGNAATKPDVIFCDTSFILDVLTDEIARLTTLLATNPDKVAKAAASAAFFHAYRGYGTTFVSSPYAFSEIGHTISQRVRPAVHRTWKDFFRADRATAEALHNETMRLILRAWRRIEGYDISFVVPHKGAHTAYGVRVEHTVVEVARLLKRAYVPLDWADAYHIAIGLACGAEWFATTDRAWKDVTEINVFCDA